MAERLSAELSLDISAFSAALQQAGQRVQQFASTVASQMAQATASLATNTTATQQNAAANNALLIAMQNLQGTARQQVTVLQQISTQIDEHAAATRKATTATSAWSQVLSVAAGVGLATSIQGITGALVNFTKSIITTGVQFEQLRLTFAAVAGSAQAGAQQFQFVINTAQKLGLSVTNLAEGYKQLAAATRGTSLAGAETMRVFEGVTTAARAMGSSQESVRGALLALEQMVSKGTVSMEELRRQLGNALPGAFQLAAKAIGVTTEQLNEMVRSGEMRSIPFVKAFGRLLLEEFAPAAEKATASAGSAFQRLGNEIVLAKDILSLGLLPALRAAANEGAKFLAIFRQYGEARALLQSAEREASLLGTGTKPSQFTEAQTKELDRIHAAMKATQDMMAKGAQDTLVAGKTGLQVLQEQEQAILGQVKAQTAVKVEQEKATTAARQARTEREREADVLEQIRTKFAEIEKEKAKFAIAAKNLPAWLGSPTGDPEAVKLYNTELQKALAPTTDKFGELLAQRPNPAAPLPADIAQGMKALNLEHAKLTTNIDAATDATKALAKAESAAEREAARLLKERIKITQDMTEQIAGVEESAFAKKKLDLEEYVAKARAAGVDIVLVAQYERDKLIQYTMEVTDAQTAQFRERVAGATAAMKAESAQIDTERKALASLRTLSEADDPIERQRLAGLQRVNEYRLALQNSMIITSTQKEQALTDATTAINQKALDDRQKQQEEAAQKALRPWRQLGEDIQRTLSDAFENVLSGTFSVWDGIKKGFIKLLSDLAAAALTQQIIIPLAMGVMGASGGLISAFTGAGGTSGLGGLAGSATGASGGLGGATSDTGSGAFGTALSMASSGASLYSGISGNSLLGSNALTSGIMNTQLSSIFGGGAAAAAPTAASFFGGGTAAAGAYATGADAGLVGAATPASAMGATVGTVAGGVGVGIAAGQIFAKLNAMMGLHGTGNKVLSGAGGGAIAGAMIGSAVPIIGTAIGAIAGALIGALGGYVSSLFGPGKPEPEFQARSVQAAQVGYSPLTGLQLTSQFQILQDTHKDVGTLDAWRQTFKAINDSLTDMAGQVVSQFQGVAPELQQALVGPLNNAFTDIAQKITGLKIAGDDAEEFAKNLQDMMGTTLPGYFTDAMQGVVAQLNGAMKKIEPVFNAFNTVIDTLQKDIDALHSQQIQMRVTLDTARNALRTELQSPAEAFMTAQGQYARAKAAFEGGNAQQQIVMAPTLAQAAQALLSMSKSNDVLGQDPQLVRNLQSGLLSDLDMLQVQTDKGFETMTASIQDLISQAEAQKKLLLSALSNPMGTDAIIETSMSALTYIQDLIAANAGEQDPLVQAQVSLLGGLTTIGTAQLQTLQDISSKLGGGVAGFAEGSPYISHSQLAYLHRGEAVVRAGDTYGGNTINLTVAVTGEATTQGASQIADAVIREIERRSSRIGSTKIMTRP